MFSLYFLLGFGSPPRCPRVGRALCPKGLLSVALASLVTEQIIQLRWCLGGLFLLASLGMQRSHAVVLFSAVCRLRQGCSPSKNVFPAQSSSCS